ncbi:uncharacterized protein LOC110847234 isoform X2 [Folsomia candida]|uniref:uncharacterized protein LOC110847234 isoform X2 n=1 Tax=Folsomia candida TaxID=158441 RepID=UPI000B8F40AC|nr:uncharacterized protein LOC110847234 isoform X2 [Folsomia candida]
MKFAVCLIIFVMFETSESAPFPPSIRKGVEYLLPSRLFYKPKKSTPYSGESVEQVQGFFPKNQHDSGEDVQDDVQDDLEVKSRDDESDEENDEDKEKEDGAGEDMDTDVEYSPIFPVSTWPESSYGSRRRSNIPIAFNAQGSSRGFLYLSGQQITNFNGMGF